MPSIETNREAGEKARVSGLLKPAATPVTPSAPSLPLNPYPAMNPFQVAPLPALAVQQPDQQRQWQTGTIPQERLINVPVTSNPQLSASALSNAFYQTGPIQVEVTQNTTQISSNTSAIAALQETSFQGLWSASVSYSQGAGVSYSSQIYVSLVNNNLNHIPSSSPTDWVATGGTETYAGNWSSATAYTIGQVVSVSSQLFIALQNSTNENPTSTSGFWQLLNASAVAAWNSATAYLINDLVSYNGNIYSSLVSPNTNNNPGSNPSDWQVFSVNPASGALAAQGSTPLSQNAGLSFTATTTSIDVSWESFAIYRADGTLTTVSNSSQNVTGLGSGRTFYLFPRYIESSATFEFVDNSDVTFPTLTGIAYNGSSQDVTTTNLAALPAAFSISFWVQVASGYSSQGGITINTSHTTTPLSSTNSVFNFEWVSGPSGQISVGYRDSGATFHNLVSPETYNDGEFHNVVYTCSPGTSSQALYVDGVSVATGSVSTAVSATTGYFWLARGASNILMDGTLTEIAFWNSALTAANAAAIFNAGNSVSQTALEAVYTNLAPTIWWKSTDAGPTTVADSGSIGGNTGTAVGSPTFGTSAPVFGAIGSPAIMWPSRSLLVSQVQGGQGSVQLTSGGWAVSTPATGTSSGTNSGSSGGSGSGGCFSPNTRVKTTEGDKRFDELQPGDFVFDKNGTARRILEVLQHESDKRIMHDLGDGELITLAHLVHKFGEWQFAGKAFNPNLIEHDGPIFNLCVEGKAFDDHSFTLANGLVCHNASFT